MTAETPDAAEILRSARSYQHAQEPGKAADLLALHRALLVQQMEPAALSAMLQELPPHLLQASPHLLYLQAQAQMVVGDLSAATASFEAARLLYTRQGEETEAVRTVLHLARLHHLREDLGMARVYTQMATELLHDPRIDDDGLEADILFRVATLAPDVGLYAQGEEMAQRALHLYERRGDTAGACDVLLILFSFNNQTGRYQISSSYLQMARQLQQIADLGAPYQVAILNKEAHWYWYQGNLVAGLQMALHAVELADRTNQRKQRVYNRLVVGNLRRAMANYAEAHRWYADTERIARQTGFDLFLHWIDAQRAWLAILEEQYAVARRLIYRALETQDRGQAMSFNVFRAVLYGLTGRYTEAKGLLETSLAFYRASGDPLSVCTLRLHLAYLCLRTRRLDEAAQGLRAALEWMAEHNVDYLPHWWHPSIIATLCAHALARDIHASLVERILVKHLGEAGVSAIHRLLEHADAVVRRRARDVLDLLDVDLLVELGPIPEETVRAVLVDLLASGRLSAAGLSRLSLLLTTAESRNTPNPSLVAVFGLHVHGAPRKAIAQQLGLAPSTVRNYITRIYEVFDLPYDPQQRAQRREMLRALAQQQGFIADDPKT